MSLFGLGKRGEELAKGLMDLLQQPQAAQTNLLNVSPQEIERIKRGEALGYNMSPEARLYHASKQDIDKLEAGYDDGLIFTTPDPEFANKWLGKGRFNERQGGTGAIEGIKAEKKRFRKEQNEIMKDMTEEQREKYFHETVMPQQRQLITDERLADNAIYPLVTKAKKPFIPDQDVNVLEELYGKEYMAAPFGSGFPTYRDALKDGNYLLYENKQVVDFLKSKGYDSMFLKESAGAENPYTTLASFDAKDLKSPYAQFKDPNNPNLLASAGALGLMSLFAPEEAEAGISKIKAFHGSPHDFDKFSTESIGTGEGAQAFGHGLYFAQREGTAKSYRDALTTPRFTFDGKPTDAIFTNEIRDRWSNVYDDLIDDDLIAEWKLSYLDSVAENGGNYEKASSELDNLVDKVLKGDETPYDFSRLDEYNATVDLNDIYDLTEAPRHLDSVLANMSQADSPSTMQYVVDSFSDDEKRIYDKFVKPKVEYVKPKGSMYEVDIDAQTDDLLDYDVPLKEQPKKIQNAFKNIWKDAVAKDPILADIYKTPDDVDFNAMGLFDESRGSQAYQEFAQKVGGDAELSKMLQDKGVKGIKYADAQTRFSPKGKTHNFVIFDDKLIDITRKYGIPPVMASAVLAGTMTPEQAMAMSESEARKGMSRKERRDNPASENLQAYAKDRAGRAAGEMGLGLLEGVGEGVDFLRPENLASMYFGLPQINTSSQDALQPVTSMGLLRDDEGKDTARLIGSLLSPI